MSDIYFLDKLGIYIHGVYWIGESLEEGIKEADLHAKRDRDDHHEWRVCKYKYSPDAYNAELVEDGLSHDVVYSVTKQTDHIEVKECKT